jgi:integrase
MSNAEPAATMTIRAFALSLRQRNSSPQNVQISVAAINRLHRWLVARGVELETATGVDIGEYLLEVGEGQAAGTLNRRRDYLKCFYSWLAADSDGEFRDPMRRIKPVPKEDPVPENVPEATEAQYRALLATCAMQRGRTRTEYQRIVDARDAAIISLLWWTGLRRSTIAGLEYKHLDQDNQTIHVISANSKSRISGDILIDDEAMEHLWRWLRYRGWQPGPLFLSTKANTGADGWRPILPDTIHLMMKRRCAKAGIDVVRFGAHAFRRSHASNWLDAGGSVEDLNAQMLWKPGSPMPARYARKERVRRSIAEARRVNEAIKARRHLRSV